MQDMDENKRPFFSKRNSFLHAGPCVPSLHEEQLIAMGLEQFTPYCKEIMPKSDDSMVRKAAVNMISSYMLPHWSAKKIADRINRLQKPNIRKNAVQVTRKVIY